MCKPVRHSPLSVPAAIDSALGELDICDLCGGSPHSKGCPRGPDFRDESRRWCRTDAPEDAGPAEYWVEDTFAAAASDAGLDSVSALREGIAEFERAIREGWLRHT
jgi:hypothetical protein